MKNKTMTYVLVMLVLVIAVGLGFWNLMEQKRGEESLQKQSNDDEWAKTVIRETLHGQSGTVIRSYDWQKRNEILRELKTKGLSLRQIERLTGISKSVVQRA